MCSFLPLINNSVTIRLSFLLLSISAISNDKDKEWSYIQFWDVNNLFGCAMSQKLPVNNFEWIKDRSQFNEVFIKNYNEESDERYFLEFDVHYIKKLHQRQMNHIFYLQE